MIRFTTEGKPGCGSMSKIMRICANGRIAEYDGMRIVAIERDGVRIEYDSLGNRIRKQMKV